MFIEKDFDIIQVGDVIQIMPHEPIECFDGCLMVVTEILPWAYMGYIVCSTTEGELPRVARYTIDKDDCIYIGEAEYTLEINDAPNLN